MTLKIGRIFWRLGTGLWLGTMFFFVIGVAPLAFRDIPSPFVDRFITHLFPIYYSVGLWFGGAATVGSLLIAWDMRKRPGWILATAASLAWLLVVYAHGLLLQMNGLNPHSGAFASLHHQSIVVNTVIMLVLLVSVIWEVWV